MRNRCLFSVLIAIIAAISAKAYIRNGYEYWIQQGSGSGSDVSVIMDQTAIMTGRTSERFNETIWYCSSTFWIDNGLMTYVKRLSVSNGYWGKVERLYATGVDLEHIDEFEVAGISYVSLGSDERTSINCAIENDAFKNSSSSIKYIELNKNISAVKSKSFANMTKGCIRCKGTPPSLSLDAFSDVAYENVALVVDDDQLSAYKKSSWQKFQHIMSESQYNTIIYFKPGNPNKVNVGSTIKLLLNQNFADDDLVWESSDESIATVCNGVVTGKQCGEVTITVTYINGDSHQCVVEVVQPVTALDILVNNHSVVGKEFSMIIGDSQELTASVFPENASDKSVKWISDDTDIVAITDTGLISAIGLGTASINCSALDGSGIVASCRINVAPVLVESVSIDPNEWMGKAGESFDISTFFIPEKATIKDIKWTSSNGNIADVSNEGKVTLNNMGNCIISAHTTDGSNLEAQCLVTVIATPAETITLNLKQGFLHVGESMKLNAEVLPVTTTDKTIIWTTSDTNVAIVDKDGSVIAKGLGETIITAKCGTLTANCTIKVVETPVTSITIDKTSVEMHVAETVQLTAIVLPENATNKYVVWDSFNESVATVNDDGLVTAEKEGSAIIRAKCGSLTALCQINVIDTKSESISLDIAQVSLKVEEKIQLTATVLPETTTDKSVIWSTSDANIANVDKTGLVTALSIGNAIITATCGDVSATCAVSVIPTPVGSISFGMTEVTLNPTETVQMDATVSPPTATTKDLIWSSSDTSVAIVDGYGLVNAVSPGQCFVMASAVDGSNISASCVVTVKPVLIESIHLDTPGWKGVKGDCFQIIATISPEDATDKTLIWTSSDGSVANVDVTGMVTAVGVGECLITASAADGSGVSASCEVSVDPILVESLTISPEEFLGAKGDSFMIIPTILPENADNKRLEYKSDNEGVAEVDSMGYVTVKDNGSAVITVRTTDGSNIEAECVITSVSGIDSLFTDDSSRFDVYDITGIMLRKDADKEDIVSLSNGIYIILKGNKVFKLNLTEK